MDYHVSQLLTDDDDDEFNGIPNENAYGINIYVYKSTEAECFGQMHGWLRSDGRTIGRMSGKRIQIKLFILYLECFIVAN